MKKYIVLVILGLCIALFFAVKGCIQQKEENAKQAAILTQDTIKIETLKHLLHQIQKSKTIVDTQKTEKKLNHITKLYESSLKKYERKIKYYKKKLKEEKESKKIIVPCDSIEVKYKRDSIINNDINLWWKALVFGDIAQMNIDYKINENNIIKNHILYDTAYKIKKVYKYKRGWGVYMVGGFDFGLNACYAGLDFYSNKKWGLGYRHVWLRNQITKETAALNLIELKWYLFGNQ